jgi:hypothetical protein
MGIRNAKRQELRRLEIKTLDSQFKVAIEQGLNCSPFEAEAIVEVVREVYFPKLDEFPQTIIPGRLSVIAVDADEPAGKPISRCEKRAVHLTVHRGATDDLLQQREGPAAFRRTRIPDLCQEALSQGGLLTREDLAYRIFFVGTRTISRDLAGIRKQNPSAPVPLRSTVKDIGPVLSHRVEIIRLVLRGKTMSEICSIMFHSPSAVANYLSTFTRCSQLAKRGLQIGQIAYLLHRSRGLVQRYLDILKECEADETMAYHLDRLLSIGQADVRKKSRRAGQ